MRFSNPAVQPSLSMNFFIPGDDLILVLMLLILKDDLSIYDNIADRGSIQRENDDREQVVSRMSGDGDVAQIDGKEIRTGARL